jgi:hypothetical protein
LPPQRPWAATSASGRFGNGVVRAQSDLSTEVNGDDMGNDEVTTRAKKCPNSRENAASLPLRAKKTQFLRGSHLVTIRRLVRNSRKPNTFHREQISRARKSAKKETANQRTLPQLETCRIRKPLTNCPPAAIGGRRHVLIYRHPKMPKWQVRPPAKKGRSGTVLPRMTQPIAAKTVTHSVFRLGTRLANLLATKICAPYWQTPGEREKFIPFISRGREGGAFPEPR